MSAGNAMEAARNGRGTKRETANWQRIGVLTLPSGSVENRAKLPKRPDGGVVTQRTANPLSLAEKRPFHHRKLLTDCIALQGTFVPSANSYSFGRK